ncbi:hypothetical protein BTUL_0106g00260 [Botrytis tulipae]|uniref:Uncharacterized protein n=1 Tax=Botrytis tulipae TaxID=87230 RepID=A0A4Z1ERG7_9HELO|nr:hypothetical protein BTUL_0106g00260 [Botrytis tulipae]
MQHDKFPRDKKADILTRQITMPGELWGDLHVKSDRFRNEQADNNPKRNEQPRKSHKDTKNNS